MPGGSLETVGSETAATSHTGTKSCVSCRLGAQAEDGAAGGILTPLGTLDTMDPVEADRWVVLSGMMGLKFSIATGGPPLQGISRRAACVHWGNEHEDTDRAWRSEVTVPRSTVALGGRGGLCVACSVPMRMHHAGRQRIVQMRTMWRARGATVGVEGLILRCC